MSNIVFKLNDELNKKRTTIRSFKALYNNNNVVVINVLYVDTSYIRVARVLHVVAV